MPIGLHSQYICFHTQSLLTDERAFKEQLAYDIQSFFFFAEYGPSWACPGANVVANDVQQSSS